jgi:hypothetical protein
MKQHETHIDTVAVQMDFEKAEEQRRKLSLLCQWVTIRELGKLEQDESSKIIIKYEVFYAGTIIFTIHSGFTSTADDLTGELEGLYYIRIRFAGLKSHIQRNDEASFNVLMTICAFLNTTRTKYRMVELDVAIDAYCSLDNILAICVKKSGKTIYNEIGHKQYYKGIPTIYIERYRNEQEANDSVVRSYVYDKSSKEGLIGSTITRFELKLQNRFFLKYGFNTQSIVNAMNKYYVMYFESIPKKNQYIRILNNFKSTSKDMEIFGLDSFRLFADENVIKGFIRQVESVYVDFYGDIVVPIAKNRND